MSKTLQITRIVIVEGAGADLLLLYNNLPYPSWPHIGETFTKMECSKGAGREYVTKHFSGVPTTIIDTGVCSSFPINNEPPQDTIHGELWVAFYEDGSIGTSKSPIALGETPYRETPIAVKRVVWVKGETE